MYRILKADKDSYVTNKAIYSARGGFTSSIYSNVGQAGTIDLFKLYKEGGNTGIELSRGVIHFNLDPIRELTGSLININDTSFKCYVNLKDVYGGQTVPSNFDLILYPLAKKFSEGRGNDVIGYRDLDAVNWLTASLDYINSSVVNPEMIEYQEEVITVTSASNLIVIPFETPFSSVPPVVITDISSALGSVNAFIDNRTTASTLYVSFSAPFIGTFVYRAAYDATPGTIKTVVRAPRFPGTFANVVLGSVPIINDNVFSVSYSDFGGNPTDTYASIYETTDDNLTNVYATITSSNTVLIGGTFSARITAQVNVLGYRSLDQIYQINSWTSGGIEASGSAGDVSGINADYYTSYLSSIGYLPLGFTQHFDRGDEDLLIDVTTAISATLAGGMPDYGFRLSYSGSQETDNVTRFVKRFSSRQSRNTNLHPRLIIKYNDTFIDNQVQTYFDINNKIGIYNSPYGNPTNFLSGAFPVSGSGSVLLKLFASQSSYVTATTYSYSHQATISYLSTSWSYFSQSFTGSQISFGGINQSGSYYADVCIPFNASGLSSVINGNSVVFNSLWTSLDASVVYTTGSNFTMMVLNASNASIPQKNYAINITNLQDVYNDKDVAKLRVFAYDFDPTLTSFYIPYDAKPKIFKNMYWSVVDPYSKETIIPFDDSGTQLSADGKGMYFNLYMQDLPINRPLEIKLLIKEYGNSSLVENQAFIFKIMNV